MGLAAAALLLAGALGLALVAATELKAASETTVTSTTEENEERTTKDPLKISKELLKKVRFGLEPADPKLFSVPVRLSDPRLALLSVDEAKAQQEQAPGIRRNVVPLGGEDAARSLPISGNAPSVDMVKLATRMMQEEAERRRRFKKKMQMLVHSPNLPQIVEFDDSGVSDKEHDTKRETAANLPEKTVDDVFGSLRRVSRIIPFLRDMFSSQFSSPFSPLLSPFLNLKRKAISSQDEKSDDKTVVVVREFSQDGFPLSLDDMKRESLEARDDKKPFFPQDSLRIDVTFYPLKDGTFIKHAAYGQLPTKNTDATTMEGENLRFVGSSEDEFPSNSRFMDIVQGVVIPIDNGESIPSHFGGKPTAKTLTVKVEDVDTVATESSVLKLGGEEQSKSIAKKVKTKKWTSNMNEQHILDKLKVMRRKRETEATDEVQSNSERASKYENRILPNDQEAETGELTTRMLLPRTAGTLNMPSYLGNGMHVHHIIGNYPTGNLNFHQMKPLHKTIPFAMGSVPMGYDKMAYYMKTRPKFAMMNMAGAMMAPKTGPVMFAIPNLERIQAPAFGAIAKTAPVVLPGGLGKAVHPMMAPNMMTSIPQPRDVHPFASRALQDVTRNVDKAPRRKRSIRSGSAFQQSFDLSNNLDESELRDNAYETGYPSDVVADRELQEIGQSAPYANTRSLDTTYEQKPFFQKPSRAVYGKYPQVPLTYDINSMKQQIPYERQARPMMFLPQFRPFEQEQEDTFMRAPENMKQSSQFVKDFMPRTYGRKAPEVSAAALSSGNLPLQMRWGLPAYGGNPFVHPAGSLLTDSESPVSSDAAVFRGKRHLMSSSVSEGFHSELEQPLDQLSDDALAGLASSRKKSEAKLRVDDSQRQGRRKIRSKSKATGNGDVKSKSNSPEDSPKFYRRVNPEVMPFLDPSMMDDNGHNDHFHRRELGNDFKLSSFDH